MRPSKKALKGRKLDVAKYRHLITPKQRLRRFTVVWVDTTGNPFDTSGFFATASTLGGFLIQTARFDASGVVVFSRIRTLTRRTLVVRTFDANGNLFRTVTVPRGNEAFAIIG
jgi:hypothetical protein